MLPKNELFWCRHVAKNELAWCRHVAKKFFLGVDMLTASELCDVGDVPRAVGDNAFTWRLTDCAIMVCVGFAKNSSRGNEARFVCFVTICHVLPRFVMSCQGGKKRSPFEFLSRFSLWFDHLRCQFIYALKDDDMESWKKKIYVRRRLYLKKRLLFGVTSSCGVFERALVGDGLSRPKKIANK